jgi:hypothetical protein
MTRSCGCLKRDLCAERISKIATKHGLIHSAEYGAWVAAKGRCLNPKNRAFKNYGGRGISIAPEWVDDFAAFYSYLGPKPSPAHSLDRINNDRGYEPGNVRWATRVEQNRNRRTFFGILDMAKQNGLSRSTIGRRRKKGLTGESLIAPVQKLKCECGHCTTCYQREWRRNKRRLAAEYNQRFDADRWGRQIGELDWIAEAGLRGV